MKRSLILIMLMWICFASIQCDAKEDITITDMTGREVTISGTPERIICISPGTLRLILYVNGGDKVVGVEDMEKANPTTRPYWIAHEELHGLPSIGPGGPNTINKEPDLEKILAANPDVIFISYMEKVKADDLKKKIHIPVIVLTYGPFGTFDEHVLDSIRLVGQVLAKEERASAVIDFIKGSQKDLLSRVEGIEEAKKPSAYVGGIGFKGTHGIESTETMYAPFEWVRVKNIAMSEGKEGHLFVDKEKLLTWNPDMIFIDGGGNDLVRQDYAKKTDFYTGLKAFREGRVHVLHSFNWYMTNLGTVIADTYTVGKLLYPDRFKDINPEEKADQIYEFLVGKPVYREMSGNFGKIGAIPDYLK